jgi:hypothetical protein
MASIGRSVRRSCSNCCSLLVERDEDSRAGRVTGSVRRTLDHQLGDDGCREREHDTNARRVWQVSQDILRRQPADRKLSAVAMASLIVGISHGGLGDLPGSAPMPAPILGGRGQLCR